jgi:osmoprotectant transport system substrate-binding protein
LLLGVLAIAVVATAMPSAGVARAEPSALRDATVTVGSFDFAESELLAEIYAEALAADGISVRRQLRIGPREIVFPALAGGLVELIPEYAGTALRFASLGRDEAGGEVDSTHTQLVRAVAPHHLTAFDPAPAEDTNTFVVTRATAERYGIDSLSDLAAVSRPLVFGGPPECVRRPFCLPALERVYGITFDEVVALDAGGELTKQALRTGIVDVALLFSTDPDLERYVPLIDDRALQPAENVTPVVRTETVKAVGPPLRERVDDVSARLTTEVLRTLNAEMAAGASARSVARRWLRVTGLM